MDFANASFGSVGVWSYTREPVTGYWVCGCGRAFCMVGVGETCCSVDSAGREEWWGIRDDGEQTEIGVTGY